MIPDIKKILYATDMSPNARYAFGYAASLANRYDAKITIIHVVEELSPTAQLLIGDIIGEKRWSSLKGEREDTIITTIRERLENFCESFYREMPQCRLAIERVLVETGPAVSRIIEAAESTDADVIVMGSHGQGMLQEVMIGSTSRRVLRRCNKPVLVVRLPENGGAEI